MKSSFEVLIFYHLICIFIKIKHNFYTVSIICCCITNLKT